VRALLFGSACVVLSVAANGCRPHATPGSNASASSPASNFKPLSSGSVPTPRPLGSEAVPGRKFPVSVVVSETNLVLEPVFTQPRKFSYESWAEWSFRRERAAAGDADAGCMREIKVTPVAWLMPLLSLREELYQSCPRAAHPGGETRLTTLAVDLNEHSLGSPRPVVLTELYDAAVVSEALRRDPLVEKALQGKDVPAELGALVRALAETPPVLDGKHCYSFPEDLLSRFAFHHREGSNVAVRLGLPGAGPCRYELTELGLLLPIPAILERTFERMQSAPELPGPSFFVVDRKDMAKTAVVHVTGGAN
jgi:hypothetical protein